MAAAFSVPLIVRGRVIAGDPVEYGSRRDGAGFMATNVAAHLDTLSLSSPSQMADLYALRFADIVEYLDALGSRLAFSENPHLQEAFRLSSATSGLSEPILRHCYETIGWVFGRETVVEMAERSIGIAYLDGWVPARLANGAEVATRAFGARTAHIVAGNVPTVSAVTIARNAITRGDAIIKTPSNDPLTAAAIARTMIDMAPDHPLTRHLSVAYWKGGDESIESLIYQPSRLEKIVAWGGLASISHISKYLQPGIDLITLDPKLSSTIVGRGAFAAGHDLHEVAERIALDGGVYNQEACLNARVVYVETGTDEAGLDAAKRLGGLVFECLRRLPAHLSGPAENLNAGLQDEIESLRHTSDYYHVIGGGRDGAVIVSLIDEPVDFAPKLANRVINLVPVDDLETPVRAVNAYTQTIGVYPDELRLALRDRLSLQGAQRIVSLGYAAAAALSQPQDAMEPLRRMCKWISEETYRAEKVPLLSRADPQSH
jgi:hypothetical protein